MNWIKNKKIKTKLGSKETPSFKKQSPEAQDRMYTGFFLTLRWGEQRLRDCHNEESE